MSMWRDLCVAFLLTALVVGCATSVRREARQRETTDEMRRVGTAIFEFITDEAGAAAAGASVFANGDDGWWDPLDYEDGRITAEGLEDLLAREPDPYNRIVRYIQFVPETDGWGRSYHYFLKQENLLSAQVTAIFSCGEPTTDVECDQAAPTRVGKFPNGCYASDLVWADGTFIAYPTAANDRSPAAECEPGQG